MPIECLTCQSNGSIASHLSYVLKLHNHDVRYYKTSSRNKSCKIKCKALKNLEERTPHKDVASLFGVPKNTLSTWKKNKDKIFEKYNSGLISKLVKPEKYDTFSYISK